MADWIVPVALSALLGPGAGQLYNKEYKKAALLIAVGALLVGWMTVSFYSLLMPYLSQDVASMDLVQLADTADHIKTQMGSIGSGRILVLNGLIMGIWIYGIYDAYRGARRRAQLKPKLTDIRP